MSDQFITALTDYCLSYSSQTIALLHKLVAILIDILSSVAYQYGATAACSSKYTAQYVQTVLASVMQYLSSSSVGTWNTVQHHLTTAVHLLDTACDTRVVAEQARVHIGIVLVTLLCPSSQLDPLIIKQCHYNLLQLLVS